MRFAVVGKGGSGKSVIAGTSARILARRGFDVLALDSDPIPGLAISLGLGPLDTAMLTDAVYRGDDGRWKLQKGVGAARAVQRFAATAPDGVRLLQYGKAGADGMESLSGSLNGFFQIVHRVGRSKPLSSWAVVGDLPAGPRQMAFNWAPYARTFLIVVEPTWQSALTARRAARIARSRPGVEVLLVANKVQDASDVATIAERIGEEPFAVVPADEAVLRADRAGAAVIDAAPASDAVRAIEDVVDRLSARGRAAAGGGR